MNLALFDLDNTLLAGDSDYNWSLFLISEGLLDAKTHHDRNEQFYQDYKNGCLDIVAFLKFQLQPLSQHKKAFLDELHLKYMQKVIKPMMTVKAQALVDRHKAAGDLCVVITATNSFVTKPIATAYGIEHLIGSDPEMLNGDWLSDKAISRGNHHAQIARGFVLIRQGLRLNRHHRLNHFLHVF